MRSNSAAAAGFRRLCATTTTLLAFGTALATPVPPEWTRDFAAPIQWQRVDGVRPAAREHDGRAPRGRPEFGAGRLVASRPRQPAGERARRDRGLAARAHQRWRDANPRTVVLNVFNGSSCSTREPRASVGSRRLASCRVPAACLSRASSSASRSRCCSRTRIDDGQRLWKSDVLDAAMNPVGNALMSYADVRRDLPWSRRSRAERAARARRRHVPARCDGPRDAHRAATGNVLWKTPFRRAARSSFARPMRGPASCTSGPRKSRQTSRSADQTHAAAHETHYQGFRLADGTCRLETPRALPARHEPLDHSARARPRRQRRRQRQGQAAAARLRHGRIALGQQGPRHRDRAAKCSTTRSRAPTSC